MRTTLGNRPAPLSKRPHAAPHPAPSAHRPPTKPGLAFGIAGAVAIPRGGPPDTQPVVVLPIQSGKDFSPPAENPNRPFVGRPNLTPAPAPAPTSDLFRARLREPVPPVHSLPSTFRRPPSDPDGPFPDAAEKFGRGPGAPVAGFPQFQPMPWSRPPIPPVTHDSVAAGRNVAG